MNAQTVFKSMLSEVYKLIRLCLTPITYATPERTFSAFKAQFHFFFNGKYDRGRTQLLFEPH